MFLDRQQTQSLRKQMPLFQKEKEKVCAVIPAAGRGSRLHSNRPKILYDFGGLRPLDIFFQRIAPLVSETVLVVSPQSREEIEKAAKELQWFPQFVLQEEPKGMAHALLQAKEKVKRFEHLLIIWGDQVTLQTSTVEAALQLHLYGGKAITLTLPLVYKTSPYISLEWNREGSLHAVRQSRDGDTMPPKGFNDCGIFVARRQPLVDLLEREWASFPREKEFNLLPLLPKIGDRILGFVVEGELQTMGLNTTQEASLLKNILKDKRYVNEAI